MFDLLKGFKPHLVAAGF